jgi:protein SSD1
MMPPELI